MKTFNMVAALGLCGCFAFLSGCCDDCAEEHHEDHHCTSCETSCSSCAESSAPVSYTSSTVVEQPVNASYVAPSAPLSSGLSAREIEIRGIRDRLVEIEREKVLYPDHAAELDAESSRLDMRLRDIDAQMQKDLGPQQPNTYNNTNIEVYDRSNLGTPLPPREAPPAAAPQPLPQEPVVQPAPVQPSGDLNRPLPPQEQNSTVRQIERSEIQKSETVSPQPTGDLNRPLPPQTETGEARVEYPNTPPITEPAPAAEVKTWESRKPDVTETKTEEFKSSEVKSSEVRSETSVAPVENRSDLKTDDVKSGSSASFDSDVELQKACEQLKKEAEAKGNAYIPGEEPTSVKVEEKSVNETK